MPEISRTAAAKRRRRLDPVLAERDRQTSRDWKRRNRERNRTRDREYARVQIRTYEPKARRKDPLPVRAESPYERIMRERSRIELAIDTN